MGKILVFGSSNIDMVLRVAAMPKRGETVKSLALDFIPGGKGANQACACARLAGDCEFLSAVGDDGNGEKLIESLRRSGVKCGAMRICRGTATGMAVISVERSGENSIVIVGGANELCDNRYYAGVKSRIEDADIVLAQLETPSDTVFALIRDAKSAGKTTILNPAPAPENLPAELLGAVDYLTPNETELELLTHCRVTDEKSAETAARMLLEKGVGNVVITLGEKGAALATAEGFSVYPGIRTSAVDTTAAGDTFNAGLAVYLSEGRTIDDAIRFGNAAASIVVSRRGAQTSIPGREEVEALLETHEYH